MRHIVSFKYSKNCLLACLSSALWGCGKCIKEFVPLIVRRIAMSRLSLLCISLLKFINSFMHYLKIEVSMVKKYYIRWCATGPLKIVENTFGAIEYKLRPSTICIFGLVVLSPFLLLWLNVSTVVYQQRSSATAASF
ncbi:uncharacterized protein LOC142627858 [Castanea sativa]|uniref:uncharacterized protein LOC142627858 n=1 Tax=Castanea sativa TaxID=21020 RepID=UPI003F64CFCF